MFLIVGIEISEVEIIIKTLLQLIQLMLIHVNPNYFNSKISFFEKKSQINLIRSVSNLSLLIEIIFVQTIFFEEQSTMLAGTKNAV